MELSLFYFPASAAEREPDPYRLLLDGARFADARNFSAVWIPERHFAPFGGLYPNPAVAGAAIAAITSRIQIRAGSVAVPLHHPLRLAEEWSMIDNLSGGRIGLSLAPGWSSTDFILSPGTYDQRRELTNQSIGQLRAIWRGEPFRDPDAPSQELLVYPRPVSDPLPLWLTSSGTPSSFQSAGRAGTGLLTNLMSQSLDELTGKVSLYRKAIRDSGSQWPGHVTLMLHTYVSDAGDAAEVARPALTRYLITAMRSFSADELGSGNRTGDRALRLAVSAACERYLSADGLIGTVDSVVLSIKRFERAGVDEIACLVDFGIDADRILQGLCSLAEVPRRLQSEQV